MSENIVMQKNIDMSVEPIIKFEKVSKTYTLYKNDQERFRALFIKPKNCIRNRALNKVSLEIRPGESVGIMGDNGCGKSTLLKTITGVTFPDKGKVTVNGTVAALLELTAGFSMDMTGRENIYMKSYVLGLDEAQIKLLEDDVIEFAELGPYIDQPVRTYSSGMKMRLGFAINVNVNPDILVVDEALSVGDAYFRKKCKDKIKEVIANNVTVLYVSHNPASVKSLCPRSIYLRKGRLIFDGPTEETHLVYQLDKCKRQAKKFRRRLNRLRAIVKEAEDKSTVVEEKERVLKVKEKLLDAKARMRELQEELNNYRLEHYGDSDTPKNL